MIQYDPTFKLFDTTRMRVVDSDIDIKISRRRSTDFVQSDLAFLTAERWAFVSLRISQTPTLQKFSEPALKHL